MAARRGNYALTVSLATLLAAVIVGIFVAAGVTLNHAPSADAGRPSNTDTDTPEAIAATRASSAATLERAAQALARAANYEDYAAKVREGVSDPRYGIGLTDTKEYRRLNAACEAACAALPTARCLRCYYDQRLRECVQRDITSLRPLECSDERDYSQYLEPFNPSTCVASDTRHSSSLAVAGADGVDYVCSVARTDGRVRCVGTDAPDATRDAWPGPLGASVRVASGAAASSVCAYNATHVYCDAQPWAHSFGDGRAVLNVSEAIVSMSVGATHTCVLYGDSGRVRCVGADTYGQMPLADDVHAPPAPGALEFGATSNVAQHVFAYALDDETLGNARSMCVGERYTCLLYAQNGNVRCSGDNGADGRNALVPLPGYAVQLACGFTDVCAVLRNRRIYCWSHSNVRALTRIHYETRPSNENNAAARVYASQLAVGHGHACLRTDIGDVSCWGTAVDTGYGITSPSSIAEPLAYGHLRYLPGGRGAMSLAAGTHRTCAVLADASVQCWGSDVAAPYALPASTASAGARRISSLSAASPRVELYCAPAEVYGDTRCTNVNATDAEIFEHCGLRAALGTGGVATYDSATGTRIVRLGYYNASASTASVTVPRELSMLTMLEELHVTGARGPLYDVASTAHTALRIFNVTRGSLSGSLPRSLGSALTAVYLSHNALSGSLPAAWSSTLRYLYVDNNALEGVPVPVTWCSGAFAPLLRVYVAHSNQLRGALPSCMASTMTALERVYLHSNWLYGSLTPLATLAASHALVQARVYRANARRNCFACPLPTANNTAFDAAVNDADFQEFRVQTACTGSVAWCDEYYGDTCYVQQSDASFVARCLAPLLVTSASLDVSALPSRAVTAEQTAAQCAYDVYTAGVNATLVLQATCDAAQPHRTASLYVTSEHIDGAFVNDTALRAVLTRLAHVHLFDVPAYNAPLPEATARWASLRVIDAPALTYAVAASTASTTRLQNYTLHNAPLATAVLPPWPPSLRTIHIERVAGVANEFAGDANVYDALASTLAATRYAGGVNLASVRIHLAEAHGALTPAFSVARGILTSLFVADNVYSGLLPLAAWRDARLLDTSLAVLRVELNALSGALAPDAVQCAVQTDVCLLYTSASFRRERNCYDCALHASLLDEAPCLYTTPSCDMLRACRHNVASPDETQPSRRWCDVVCDADTRTDTQLWLECVLPSLTTHITDDTADALGAIAPVPAPPGTTYEALASAAECSDLRGVTCDYAYTPPRITHVAFVYGDADDEAACFEHVTDVPLNITRGTAVYQQLHGSLSLLASRLRHLRGVHFCNGELSGDVPALSQWASSATLTHANVQNHTALTGTLNNTFMSPALTHLTLANAWTFGGTLPSTLPTALAHLDVHSASLTGSLPSTWTAPLPERVFLHNNSFTGAIPSGGVFCNASAFRLLDAYAVVESRTPADEASCYTCALSAECVAAAVASAPNTYDVRFACSLGAGNVSLSYCDALPCDTTQPQYRVWARCIWPALTADATAPLASVPACNDSTGILTCTPGPEYAVLSIDTSAYDATVVNGTLLAYEALQAFTSMHTLRVRTVRGTLDAAAVAQWPASLTTLDVAYSALDGAFSVSSLPATAAYVDVASNAALAPSLNGAWPAALAYLNVSRTAATATSMFAQPLPTLLQVLDAHDVSNVLSGAVFPFNASAPAVALAYFDLSHATLAHTLGGTLTSGSLAAAAPSLVFFAITSATLQCSPSLPSLAASAALRAFRVSRAYAFQVTQPLAINALPAALEDYSVTQCNGGVNASLAPFTPAFFTSSLLRFNVSGNALYGSMTDNGTLASFNLNTSSTVRVFDVSRNALSGALPSFFATALDALATVYVLARVGDAAEQNCFACPLPFTLPPALVASNTSALCVGAPPPFQDDLVLPWCAASQPCYEAQPDLLQWSRCLRPALAPAYTFDATSDTCSTAGITCAAGVEEVHRRITSLNVTLALAEYALNSSHVAGASLVEQWALLTQLTSLDVRYERSAPLGVGDAAWWDTAWANGSLAFMRVRSNALAGELRGAWGASWGATLQTLSLGAYDTAFGDNACAVGLTGTLPSEWAALTRLQTLDVSRTGLGGTLPTEWASLGATLRTVRMAHANFSGAIPAEYAASWTNVPYLDVSANALSGAMPAWLADYATNSSTTTRLLMYAFEPEPETRIVNGTEYPVAPQVPTDYERNCFDCPVLLNGSLVRNNSAPHTFLYEYAYDLRGACLDGVPWCQVANYSECVPDCLPILPLPV